MKHILYYRVLRGREHKMVVDSGCDSENPSFSPVELERYVRRLHHTQVQTLSAPFPTLGTTWC